MSDILKILALRITQPSSTIQQKYTMAQNVIKFSTISEIQNW